MLWAEYLSPLSVPLSQFRLYAGSSRICCLKYPMQTCLYGSLGTGIKVSLTFTGQYVRFYSSNGKGVAEHPKRMVL